MNDASQFTLLKQKRFAPFFWTQFLGAFNDNVYKNALIILLAFHATSMTSLDSNTLVNLAAGIFILPFFLFSATSGQLADKFEKSRLTRLVKMLEIGIMMCGAAGFMLASLPLLLFALFMMGTHSTLFGPVKYAILPQHLKPEELIGGNGLVEMGTFVAILLGTILGGALIALQAGPLFVSAAVIGIAVLGWLASLGVPHSPAPAPDLKINWNPLTETWRNFAFTRRNRTVFLSVLGISWFWFYGAMFLSQFPHLSKDVLGGNEQVVTLLLTTFSIGIGMGSLLCEKLSGGKVELGLVPFGSIGLTLFGIDLYLATPGVPLQTGIGAVAFLQQAQHWRLILDLAMIGVFGGFYIVPLYALIQLRSDASHRSRIIAGNNILNALFMVLAAAMAIGLIKAGLSVPQLLLVTALLNAAVAVYIYTLVPEFLMRFIIWILVHTLYRVEKEGLQHIPEHGPALLVCNHVSFADALVIAAACRRPIRFIMDHNIFKIPVLSFVFRTARTIPIAPFKEDPALMEQAFDEAAKALAEGDLVCIFPEGKITATGDINPFRPGVTRILERIAVPVVPLALRGLWGSFFSRRHGAAMRIPRGIFSRIGLAATLPMPAYAATPEALQQTVQALRGDWR